MIDPNDVGRWDGDRFIFEPPLTVTDAGGTTHTFRVIDLSRFDSYDGITRDDVIHAMINPVRITTIGGEP